MGRTADVVIVGAGPYGLSLAAHLAASDLDVRVFGQSMKTWRDSMPSGMKLKSEGFASSLSDPAGRFTLGHYCREEGIAYAEIGWPVPVEVFAAYGQAFARRFVPQLDARRVTGIAKAGRAFTIDLEDGEVVTARRVVLATGIGAFGVRPSHLAALPPASVSHSSQHADYRRFAGQAVAVIGAGASALDATAALRRAGASPTLVSRNAAVTFNEAGPPRRPIDAVLSPLTPLGPGWKKLLCCKAPLLFHALPARLRVRIVRRYLGPAPGWFVRDTIEGHVPYCLDATLVGAKLRSDGRVALAIDRTGQRRSFLDVDHVIAATGYKVDLSRLGLLAGDLLSRLRVLDLSPVLSRNFECSIDGLYVVGTPSAYSFGPMFRFACGADYAARRVTRHILARTPSRRDVTDPASLAAAPSTLRQISPPLSAESSRG